MKKISFENLKNLTHQKTGLTNSEVDTQRSLYGRNEIVEVSGNPWLELFVDTFKDPMIWFLIGIGSVFLILGNQSEALTLFVAIVPLIFMDAFLHWRTQASTSGLKAQLTSQVNVIRNGNEIQIDSTDLVPGDLLKISPGLFIPADGIFQNTTDLQIDESALTGESFPIQKQGSAINPFEFSLTEEISIPSNTLAYAGTRVLTGHGQLLILFTGSRTAYGEIVQSVSAMPHERTPLQQSISKLVQGLIIAAAIFCLLLATVRIYQGHGWLDALLSAATLAIAAIPEEFPVVFSFFLGVGVYRLAKKHALVRRAVSVENIGRVTYICTDKTGTITMGHLTLSHLDPFGKCLESDILHASLAASNPNGTDPVDIAIQEMANQQNISTLPRLHVYPFTEDRKQETVIVADLEKNFVAYTKGSPELIISKSILSDEERNLWLGKISTWAKEGHKVIACAKKNMTREEVEQKTEPESAFEFCGLLAFEDPPRPEVADAIKYCLSNGIRVLMITGDHPMTALAIAKNIGLGGSSPIVITAVESNEKFQADWLNQNPNFLKNTDVIARCTPIQKLHIVNALKKSGELVAVTGDGVNDVPALKAADIGIAMGQRGSRSAKEVASIILSDDNFQTIVNAIMEGRQLFSNLTISFEYLLLFHIPFVLTAALIPLFGFPLLYLPIHIVWLELIIHPTALFAFQSKASQKNQKPKTQSGFFSKKDIIRIIFIGAGMTTALCFCFIYTFGKNGNTDHARSMLLSILTLWSAGLVVYFTQCITKTSIVISVTTILSSILLIQTSIIAKALHLAPLHFQDWLITATTVLVMVFSLHVFKK